MKNNKSSFFCLPFPWVLSCFYLEKLVIIFNTSPKGDWGVLHLWLQNIFFDRIGLSIHSFVMWCLAETVAILFSINKHCLMIITLLYIPFYVCFSRSWTKKKPEESAMGKWYRTQAKVWNGIFTQLKQDFSISHITNKNVFIWWHENSACLFNSLRGNQLTIASAFAHCVYFVF